jgi:SulP family sulfate permease
VAYVGNLLSSYREKYPEQKHLLLLTKGINQVDMSGAELLQKEALERRKMGGELYMYRLKDSAMRVLNRGNYMEALDRDTIFDSKETAIQEIFKKLDHSICSSCDKRVFRECRLLPEVAAEHVDEIPVVTSSETLKPDSIATVDT